MDSARARRIATIAFFAAALLLHARRCVNLFTPPGSLFSDQPLVTDDNSMHSYYTLVGSQLIKRTGQSQGYVPMEMAGHPKTAIYDAGIVPVERLMATLSFLPPFLVYKLFVLLSMSAVALAALLALYLLGLRGMAWGFGWMLVLFHYWWGQGTVFTMGGMNTWLLAASLVFLLASVVARLVRRWSWPWAVTAGALMCLAPYVHPIGGVPVVLAAGVLVVMRRERLRTLLFVGASGLLALLLNWGWMSSTRQHAQISTPLGELLGAAESPQHLLEVAVTDLRASPGLSKTVNRLGVLLFNIWIVAGALLALVWLWRKRDARFLPLAAPFVVLGFLTYLSGPIGALQNIQPWRLRFLFLMIASAALAVLCAEGLRGRGVRRLLALGTGLFACLYFLAFDARPDIPPLRVGFDPIQRQWIEQINAMADERARVLAEDGPGYREMGLAALHLGTRTQWVGGPYRGAYITYHKVNFISGKLSERPIADYQIGELDAFFRRYNVHWILAWSPESKRVLDGHTTLVRRVKELGGLAFYELLAPADSFFERGSGRLKVDLDLLEVEQAVPDNGSIVLRYHYYDHLVVEGAQALKPYALPDDPVGFIEVLRPGGAFRIHGRHGSSGTR